MRFGFTYFSIENTFYFTIYYLENYLDYAFFTINCYYLFLP